MIRLYRLAVVSSATVLVLLTAFTTTFANESVTDLIVQADWAYTTRHLQESMVEAIALFEAVLPSLDTLSIATQTHVLNRLSQLCYEAPSFSEGDTPEDDGGLYEKGKAYGLQSLRLSPQFAETEAALFEKAVSDATDTAALHWTASNWGKLCGMNPFQGLFQQSNVLALFSRCVEVNPEYWGGSASVARLVRCWAAVHRAWKLVGEWLLRELNGRLRDELLNGEIFCTLQEAKILVENWRREYNEIRSHGNLNYRPPAPQTRTLIPALAGGGRLD